MRAKFFYHKLIATYSNLLKPLDIHIFMVLDPGQESIN